MWYILLTLVTAILLFVPFEYMGINEDFLYIVAFTFFFYNLIFSVAPLAYNELAGRRHYISNLYTFLLNFKIYTISKLVAFFNFVISTDFEHSFSEIIFYWNSWLYAQAYSEFNSVQSNELDAELALTLVTSVLVLEESIAEGF